MHLYLLKETAQFLQIFPTEFESLVTSQKIGVVALILAEERGKGETKVRKEGTEKISLREPGSPKIHFVGVWKQDLHKRDKADLVLQLAHCNFIALARRGKNGF
jgi:hypothetical protein